MHDADTWANTFFSGNPPEFIGEVEDSLRLREFYPNSDNWRFGAPVDKTRLTGANKRQVFWLRNNERGKYVAKVFPNYTREQAAEQLRRLRVPLSQTASQIENAVYEFDGFFREARAYSRIEQFCPRQEQIYFPQFHGVLINIGRSKFSSGYAQPRALVLEAVHPDLRSRRILAQDISLLPDSFQTTIENLYLSLLEREWYRSLLCDRLRRLAALHRIGVTHGDLHDHHFRLPGDIYDTVLFDFSESYTFTPHWPFRINSGKPRPLAKISEGERRRVELHIQKRAVDRDLRSYLVESMAECIVDDALRQPLDTELPEVIIVRVWTRPDYFSVPSLNSVFPFLEAICPEDDPAWHIRKGRLLSCYGSVWASFITGRDRPTSVSFYGEPGFEIFGSNYFLCLVPQEWNIGDRAGSDSINAEIYDKLRRVCLDLVSSRVPGYIVKAWEFLKKGEQKP